MSKDTPERQKRFVEKFGFQFPLLCDPSTETLQAYGAWGLKKSYGREYEGTHRVSYLIDENGRILKAYPKVKTKTPAQDVLTDLEA